MEDNGDDTGSKPSRKGNVGARVGAKWGIHDTTGLYLYEFWHSNEAKITVSRGQCIVCMV